MSHADRLHLHDADAAETAAYRWLLRTLEEAPPPWVTTGRDQEGTAHAMAEVARKLTAMAEGVSIEDLLAQVAAARADHHEPVVLDRNAILELRDLAQHRLDYLGDMLGVLRGKRRHRPGRAVDASPAERSLDRLEADLVESQEDAERELARYHGAIEASAPRIVLVARP